MIRKSEITLKNFFLYETMDVKLDLLFVFFVFSGIEAQDYGPLKPLAYKREPAPDGHRCGVCPTYFQKVCAFDFLTNSTHIFDNHCVMDLYNCIEATEFAPMKYEKCLFFGNFAYVHGYKHEDEDYGEDHIIVKNSKKNPDFINY
ncbi:hypothetical protein PYW08_013883 [Mythimna loreyi]|uniref:Uncharacterized protein n=1 Tax=Mythimna loreyi TaxID=667449 RepID=A0ACC2R749_9NEOP|nr:hypothetical protein PYW08_013883 [Mythimna loreyi]